MFKGRIGMSERQIDLRGVASFVRANWVRVAVRGSLTLLAAAALLALYVAFAPRFERYSVEVQVTLDARSDALHYPNGEGFSARDIISAPVLDRAWRRYGLGGKGVRFRDFCGWFGIVSYDRERARVDAEFHEKMARRNITVTELTAVQREYEERLASLSVNRFVLSMRPGVGVALDRETAARLLNDIPEIWFEEYSRLKAPPVPPVAAGDAVRAYAARIRERGPCVFELMDVLDLYWRELRATCRYVRDGLMKGRNAQVDGVDLGAHESRMHMLRVAMLRVRGRVLASGSPADFSGFVASRLEDIACERTVVEERIAAVQRSIDALGDVCRRSAGPSAAPGGGGAAAEGGAVTVQADAGFFSDFADMVRRGSNQEQIGRYVDELTSFRKDMAEIKSRELYYGQIMRHLSENGPRGGAEFAEARADLDTLISDLLEVGERIVGFRDRCFSVYRTSDQFYAIAAPAAYGRSYVLPLPRAMAGLLAAWALANLALLARDWRAGCRG